MERDLRSCRWTVGCTRRWSGSAPWVSSTSQSVSIRPWTRQECRRQLREAEDILFGFGSLDYDIPDTVQAEAKRMFPDLEQELQEPDGEATATLEAVYGTGRSDRRTSTRRRLPLRRQTWWNDYGRPLGRGTTGIVGYSLARDLRTLLFSYPSGATNRPRPSCCHSNPGEFFQPDRQHAVSHSSSACNTAAGSLYTGFRTNRLCSHAANRPLCRGRVRRQCAELRQTGDLLGTHDDGPVVLLTQR